MSLRRVLSVATLGAIAVTAFVVVSSAAAPTRETERLGAITVTTRQVATPGGTRPFHLIRFPPNSGVHLEAVWLGGGPGRTGTVGGYVQRNAAKGAVGGLNGDFFLLQRKVPSGNLFIHRGRNFLGNGLQGAVFGADGSVDVRGGGTVGAYALLREGVREATSGKPIYVDGGRVGDLSSLELSQRTPTYHRPAVGRFANGDTGLVVVGGAGLSARNFALGLVKLGFVEALGTDLNSSANINWRGRTLNRAGTQRQIPTGIIVFRRVAG